MGLFQSIFNLADPAAKKYKKAKNSYQRRQYWKAIADAEAAKAEHEQATKWQRGALRGQLYGTRGFGKGDPNDKMDLANQTMAGFEATANRRGEAIDRGISLAWSYRRYVKAGINYERKSQYAQLLDGILSLAYGIGQGGGTSKTQGQSVSGVSYTGGGQGDVGTSSGGGVYGGFA